MPRNDQMGYLSRSGIGMPRRRPPRAPGTGWFELETGLSRVPGTSLPVGTRVSTGQRWCILAIDVGLSRAFRFVHATEWAIGPDRGGYLRGVIFSEGGRLCH